MSEEAEKGRTTATATAEETINGTTNGVAAQQDITSDPALR